ncbi:Ribonuclease 1 [Carex littledalei]|uniref:Ribonuclease 1 n=1 Tax=Carex littledalei TaxID=544730 RepID=A0A833QNW0_9POAL|nr:Ribonuclease 1 [Carex littledalei]
MKANLLKALQDAGIEPDDRFYSVDSIKIAIKESIGFTPGFECNRDESGNQQLSEVYLCIDTSSQEFIECPTFPRISCKEQAVKKSQRKVRLRQESRQRREESRQSMPRNTVVLGCTYQVGSCGTAHRSPPRLVYLTVTAR